ncbi:MAG: hypothetical protein A2920_00130 [Candidatus Zambryskibacteria bacterium RIFCSPLOWO2_01_FULL_43_17]|uniref:Uncharacterized protein n=1 Tax=Candidatus Zambryskibacteria bacterium RIFCSPLOWO2_01_FULL_43_17 TaxID=1802760 RepID=A0A1G2U303_9BACT|nr:MAG: hypothetical protein A2920_00130 [Candidatus Zambryskibacteria bacterium RIFCSPLOWO2_01_FULL_43_17]
MYDLWQENVTTGGFMTWLIESGSGPSFIVGGFVMAGLAITCLPFTKKWQTTERTIFKIVAGTGALSVLSGAILVALG